MSYTLKLYAEIRLYFIVFRPKVKKLPDTPITYKSIGLMLKLIWLKHANFLELSSTVLLIGLIIINFINRKVSKLLKS